MSADTWQRWLLAFDAVRARDGSRPVACREACRLVLGVEPDLIGEYGGAVLVDAAVERIEARS